MSVRKSISFLWFLLAGSLMISIITLAGCASTGEQPTVKVLGIYWPRKPELPRIQYLRSFTSAKDIETAASKFDEFLTGQETRIVRLDKPYGVAIYDGKIFVADSNFSVMIFDLKGRKFHRLEGAKGLGKTMQPLNIVVDKEGKKYVTDPVRGQLLVYGQDDAFITAFGTQIDWTPIDVAIFEDRLYVIDKSGQEVWVLEKETGELIDKIGKKSDKVMERLFRPTNLAFSPEGNLYISDAARFQVVKFDRDGHFLGTIGILGTSPGRFSRPKGIATDREGRVYVADAAFDNVQVFNKEGRLLLAFGGPGNRAGDLNLPAKVLVDYDHVDYFSDYIAPDFEAEALIIVVSQFGPRLVNVYALGKQKGADYPSDEEVIRMLDDRKQEILKKQQGEE